MKMKILFGLGKMYAGGGEFTENINKMGGEGTAEFTYKAIAGLAPIKSTKIVPFQYERSTFTVFFFENKCVIFTMDKANGKTKKTESPSPFSFAKEYRQTISYKGNIIYECYFHGGLIE